MECEKSLAWKAAPKLGSTPPRTLHIDELEHLDLYVVGSEEKIGRLEQTPSGVAASPSLP